MSENKSQEPSTIFNYIYLIQEREFIRLQEPVYKIGRTCQQDFKRFDGYPKNSHLVLMVDVVDCKAIELLIIKKFKGLFKHRKDYGNEYFEGEKMKMIKEILDIVQTFKPEPVKTKEMELEKERMRLEKERLELAKEKKLKLEKDEMELEIDKLKLEKQKLELEKEKQKLEMVKRELIEKREEERKSSYQSTSSMIKQMENMIREHDTDVASEVSTSTSCSIRKKKKPVTAIIECSEEMLSDIDFIRKESCQLHKFKGFSDFLKKNYREIYEQKFGYSLQGINITKVGQKLSKKQVDKIALLLEISKRFREEGYEDAKKEYQQRRLQNKYYNNDKNKY